MTHDDEHDLGIEESSGNVFEDLGLPDAQNRLAKAMLSRVIGEIMARRGWTQAAAARIAKIAPSDMSNIARGRLANFSLERLQTVILDLGYDIRLEVLPKRPEVPRGRMRVEGLPRL